MAKAPKKSTANKTKPAKPNTLTINLGNLQLTEAQHKKLLDAVYKTVGSKLKTAAKKTAAEAPPTNAPMRAGAAPTTGATITATFRNVNPGASELTATYNDEAKTINQSGTINFDAVRSGEIIMVQGKSLGKAEIVIDRKAEPQSKNFDPGIILFNFLIA